MCLIFFFNDTATTEIYTLSLHDALPIFGRAGELLQRLLLDDFRRGLALELVLDLRRLVEPLAVALGDLAHEVGIGLGRLDQRSEEHTSELQSRQYLVCRLLLEKKKTILS